VRSAFTLLILGSDTPQAMVKTIYEHFEQLYAQLRASAPHLAAEHTLREEADVYARSTKLTYRNAAVNALVQIKKRPPPTGVGHPSVGTSAEIAARAAAVDELAALTLTREHLAPLVLSPPDLERWGYIIDVPPGPGGDCPSEEGKTRDCERCGEKFEVRGIERAQQCTFHWGRSRTVKVNGQSVRIL
jgi:RNA exonuclease 1